MKANGDKMTPEQRKLVNKLKLMHRELEKWDKVSADYGYAWTTTRSYLLNIIDKIDDTINYMGG
jgi:hypothetical protein